MVRPRVELQARVGSRHALQEPPRRVHRANARGVVGSARRRLTHRDERAPVLGLDPLVARRVEPGVVPRRDRTASTVELWREEDLQVRLVPDRPEADEGIPLVTTGVACRDRARERREVAEAPRHDVRRLPAVRPAWRADEREEHFHVLLLGGANRVVEVVEVVGRIEWIRRERGTLPRGLVPAHQEPHHRSALARRGLDPARAVVDPAEARVVVESDPHPLGRMRRRRGQRGCGKEQEDET